MQSNVALRDKELIVLHFIFVKQLLPCEHHVGKVRSPVDLVLGSFKFTSLFDA